MIDALNQNSQDLELIKKERWKGWEHNCCAINDIGKKLSLILKVISFF